MQEITIRQTFSHDAHLKRKYNTLSGILLGNGNSEIERESLCSQTNMDNVYDAMLNGIKECIHVVGGRKERNVRSYPDAIRKNVRKSACGWFDEECIQSKRAVI